MATHVSSRSIFYARPLRLRRILDSLLSHLPAPHPLTLTATILLLGGLSIPVLMVLEIIPVTFLLGFVGFVMTGSGGILALVLCGEI